MARKQLVEEMPEVVDWLHYRIVGMLPLLIYFEFGEADVFVRCFFYKGLFYDISRFHDCQG